MLGESGEKVLSLSGRKCSPEDMMKIGCKLIVEKMYYSDGYCWR